MKQRLVYLLIIILSLSQMTVVSHSQGQNNGGSSETFTVVIGGYNQNRGDVEVKIGDDDSRSEHNSSFEVDVGTNTMFTIIAKDGFEIGFIKFNGEEEDFGDISRNFYSREFESWIDDLHLEVEFIEINDNGGGGYNPDTEVLLSINDYSDFDGRLLIAIGDSIEAEDYTPEKDRQGVNEIVVSKGDNVHIKVDTHLEYSLTIRIGLEDLDVDELIEDDYLVLENVLEDIFVNFEIINHGGHPDAFVPVEEILFRVEENGKVKIVGLKTDESYNVLDIEIDAGEEFLLEGLLGWQEIIVEVTPDDGYIIDEIYSGYHPLMLFPIDHARPNIFSLDIMFPDDFVITFIEQKDLKLFAKADLGGEVLVEYPGMIEALTLSNTYQDIDLKTKDEVKFVIKPSDGYLLGGVLQYDINDEFLDDIVMIDYDPHLKAYVMFYQVREDSKFEFFFTEMDEENLKAYYEDVAILISDDDLDDDALIIDAIENEYVLRGINVENKITLNKPIVDNTDYKVINFTIEHREDVEVSAVAYIVDDETKVLFIVEQTDKKEEFITKDFESFEFDVSFEISSFDEALISIYGVNNLLVIPMDNHTRDTFLEYDINGIVLNNTKVLEKAFYKASFHIINQGSLNWFNFHLIQEDALFLNILPQMGSDFQETLAWSLNHSTVVNDEDVVQEVFFGNKQITIQAPNTGNVKAVDVIPSTSPGYTFELDNDGNIIVTFNSNYYELVKIPLILTLEDGSQIEKVLTIHRVGLEIQEHSLEDGNPAKVRNTWFGTEYGSNIYLDDYGFKLTASYYIPDFGEDIPYGLFVTKRFADGTITTEVIREPINDPKGPLFNKSKLIFNYNKDNPNFANIVDYLIHEGPNKASAPIEVSVLVLKEAIDTQDAFGGLLYGSGLGVTWKK